MKDKHMEEIVEMCVKQIALNRKVVEVRGEESVDDFDRQLNELCEKWREEFSKMDSVGLAIWMLEAFEKMIKEEARDDG